MEAKNVLEQVRTLKFEFVHPRLDNITFKS